MAQNSLFILHSSTVLLSTPVSRTGWRLVGGRRFAPPPRSAPFFAVPALGEEGGVGMEIHGDTIVGHFLDIFFLQMDIILILMRVRSESERAVLEQSRPASPFYRSGIAEVRA